MYDEGELRGTPVEDEPMHEQEAVFSTHVGPDGVPAVGTRMAVTEERAPDGRLRVTDAAPDPGGAWVVTRVTSPDPDGAIDIYLAPVPERP